jgi:putative membrane protein insertion efficiency factor
MLVFLKKIVLKLLRLYQYTFSLYFPSSCRFYPSCSEYTYQAVEKYGIIKGLFLGTKRVLKCHPFHPGGYDPLK